MSTKGYRGGQLAIRLVLDKPLLLIFQLGMRGTAVIEGTRRDCLATPGGLFRRVWMVGFAGHRTVKDAVKAKSVIRRDLDEMAASLDGEVIGLSSAAAGADLLFLEACAEAGLKTVVILPFERHRFSDDFDDPAEWARAERLIDSAWWSETAPGHEEAPAAYHVVSRELLELADRMIFLWDGKPPRGLGGTAETVQDASEMRLPSKIIDATTHESRWQSGQAPACASDSRFAGLPAAATVNDLFQDLDARAVTNAPKSRWLNAGSMSFHHLTTFFLAGVVALQLPREVGGVTRFVLAVAATALPWIGSRARLQERWVSDRVATELLRSLLASHDSGSPLRPHATHLFDRDASLLRSASLHLVPERRGWEAARDNYLGSRLDDQIEYLQTKGSRAASRLRSLNWLFYLSSGGAILFGGLLVASHFLEWNVRPEWREWGFFFLPMVLPGVAAWCLAMISVFEFKRRAKLYRQLVGELERLRPKLAAAKCASATATAILQCERLLLNELWEWQGQRRS